MTEKGCVSSIKRFMRNDGPGIRTVVFLKGCPLRCLWCSSPQTWTSAPEVVFLKNKCIGCGRCAQACAAGAIQAEGHRLDYDKCTRCGACTKVCPPQALRFDGQYMTVDEVVQTVLMDRDYYSGTGGGVTLSGGEATVQADFAAAILKKCREYGLHTAIESCFATSWENISKVLAYTDVLYCDVKHLDTEMHKKLTGLGNERILENLKRAVETASCRIVLNFPMIPACNVDEKNCVAFAQMMQDLSLRDVRLLRFHCLGEHEYNELGIQYPAKEFPKLTDQMIADIQEIFVQRGIRIVTE